MTSVFKPTNDRPWRVFAGAAFVLWYIGEIESAKARRAATARRLDSLESAVEHLYTERFASADAP